MLTIPMLQWCSLVAQKLG